MVSKLGSLHGISRRDSGDLTSGCLYGRYASPAYPLIIEGYELNGFLEGTLSAPPRFANLVESDPSLTMVAPSHGGRSSSGGRGKGFCNRIQCQIYGRFGHLTQRCYYRFGRDYGGDSAPNTAPVMVPSGDDGHGSRNAPGGEQGWWAARSARGGSTVLGVHR
ncbi:hypothetical protein PVK06_025021 [Gossypium arboreum]|uniref:Uncharacterized protein n=1 Tax=Gossypium arboreum TaxID=29729 RepID=A0ABR0PFN1_GOSAR|nr:hypothetical protein PVK06_025021 [Gossypium arboreum]